MNGLFPVEPGGRDPYEALPDVDAHFQSRARREGTEYDAVALDHLKSAGAVVVRGRHHRGHYPVDAEIVTPNGGRFLVLAHGNLDDTGAQPGLQRPDTFAKVAHRCLMLAGRGEPPAVVVTSHLPRPNSRCAYQLADLHDRLGSWLADVIATTADLPGFQRVRWLFTSEPRPSTPRRAPWWRPGHDRTLFDFLDPGTPDA